MFRSQMGSLGATVYSVKLNLVPETGLFEEKGLKLRLDELELSEPFVEGSLSFDMQLRRIGDKVMGKFAAQGRYDLTCSRCLISLEEGFSTEFIVDFEPEPKSTGSRSDLDPEDPDLAVSYFKNELLPLGEEFRQELELLIPWAPLCKKDCKGLCLHCGLNLNEHDCPGTVDDQKRPFAKLSQLLHQAIPRKPPKGK